MTRDGAGAGVGLLLSLLGCCGAAPEALSTAREQGVVVALEDGRVLAAGGRDGARTLASGEVYEPGAGRWRPTGALHTARRHFAAVRLGDGRVLGVGGVSAAGGALASAEVYEPASGRWTPVAALSEAREDPALVRLGDGRVLVVGGVDSRRRPVRSAEIYDPVRDVWTRTGAPSATRQGALTGVLLEDGRALFVSGLQAEVYAPARGDWPEAGPVGGAAGTHRSGHTVTRLRDGRVLVVGGATARAAATAEVYAPASGRWTRVASPGTPREAHAAGVGEDGRVWVAGGAPPAGAALASVEVYDPVRDVWSEAPALAEPQRGGVMVPGDEGAVRVVGPASSEHYSLAPCEPLTCEAEAPVCGPRPDGCGGTVVCGPCEAPLPGGAGRNVERAGYDARLGALRCEAAERGCGSGTELEGRGPLGPEPHAPNTLGSTCADGTGGGVGRDESLDALRVLTEDGGALSPGRRVRVEATVWAHAEPEADRLDIYAAADARAPEWLHVATLTPEGPGEQVLTATYVLPPGALQAVRGVFRYAGRAEPCPEGAFDDVDDLVFATR